jgi:hypothetical protein
MKYIAPLFALISAPVHAHSTMLLHAHEVSFTPVFAGLAVIALGGLLALRHVRGVK